MYIKFLIMSIIILITLPVFAATKIDNFCVNEDGDRVKFKVMKEDVIFKARAKTENGKPVILISKEVYENLSNDSLLLVTLHECAHHYLGHIKYYPVYQRSDITRFLAEDDADCFSVVWFVQKRGESKLAKAMDGIPFLSSRRKRLLKFCAAEHRYGW